MDNDQRDRGAWRDPDDTFEGPAGEPKPSADDAAQEPPATEPIPPAEPAAGDWSAGEPSPSAAEIESWPSQDAALVPPEGTEPAGTPPWPTEPPAAGSAPDESWPTTAPERGETYHAPDTEPTGWDAAPSEAVPSEVEAHPAAMGADADVPPMAAAAAATTSAHTVPDGESATGESTQCPRCGTENRPGLAFCRNCGQRLVAAGVATTVDRPGTAEGTQACPRCGTHNRAGVAFCQNCGANLRGTAPGYVPPTVVGEGEAAEVETGRRGAILGPVVLLVGVVGLITAYLLPFLYGSGSLFERAFGSGGYGGAFWLGYPDVGAGLADQAYFGLAAPVPAFALLLVILAIAGFVRAAPGIIQTVGLVVSLLWSVALIVLFVVVELAGNWDGDLVGVLRVLTPAGIIFFLASLIILIGTLTRFGRS